VGIARAVVAKPTLLIADEPTGNLDPELALEIMKLFKRFNDVGVTVVIATHDVHLIDHFGARRIVLGEGRVTDAGQPSFAAGAAAVAAPAAGPGAVPPGRAKSP
jgi:cell division transport system ATP-binding protein